MWHPSLARALERPQGMRFYRDDFTTLSSVWQVVNGTLAVSGGGLRGATVADFGGDIMRNGEFTTNTANWTAQSGATLTRRDYAVAPAIAPTGGADNFGLEVATGGNVLSRAEQTNNLVTSSLYVARCRAYAPSGNAVANAAVLYARGESRITGADAWATLTRSFNSVGVTNAVFYVQCDSATVGDLAHFDAIVCYRQSAAAILGPWRSPNFVTTLHHRSPAAGVVPWGWMFRRTDSLSYWELRVLPNTAGNDLQIVQVTAGVETVRAEADIDWTSNGVDEIELSVLGTAITTAHKKSGAAIWTAGPSFSPATQGQTERGMGPLFYGVDQNRLDSVEVVGR